MHYHLVLIGVRLLDGLPPGVQDFAVIGGELVFLQGVYRLLAKLLGFDDIV